MRIQDLRVVDSAFDLESGFMWVLFDNEKSIQCCLVSEDGGYIEKIDSSDCGSDEGLSFDCNEWALEEVAEFEEINKILFEEAGKLGVEVI